MEKISKISSSNYIPEIKDILYAKVKTTGIIDQRFTCEKGYTYG